MKPWFSNGWDVPRMGPHHSPYQCISPGATVVMRIMPPKEVHIKPPKAVNMSSYMSHLCRSDWVKIWRWGDDPELSWWTWWNYSCLIRERRCDVGSRGWSDDGTSQRIWAASRSKKIQGTFSARVFRTEQSPANPVCTSDLQYSEMISLCYF